MSVFALFFSNGIEFNIISSNHSIINLVWFPGAHYSISVHYTNRHNLASELQIVTKRVCGVLCHEEVIVKT